MTADRPNILVICTDQQRYDAAGCYGNPHIQTPTIDALAREGVLFERCYVQSPVCAPSRASTESLRSTTTTLADRDTTTAHPCQCAASEFGSEMKMKSEFKPREADGSAISGTAAVPASIVALPAGAVPSPSQMRTATASALSLSRSRYPAIVVDGDDDDDGEREGKA